MSQPHSLLPEFFRYHGVWAPGVRLMRGIGFRAKAVIIAAMFLMPLAWIGSQYLMAKAGAIEFSSRERVGVVYARAALPLIDATLRDRLARVKALYNVQPTEAPPDLNAALEALRTVDAQHGADYGTRQRFAQVEAVYKKPVPTDSPAAVMGAYRERVGAVLALLGASNDSSNLTLDPDLDTYYLMEISVLRLPEMIDATAQVRSLALLMLMGKVEPAQVQRLVIENLALTRNHAAAIEAGLAKAGAYNPDVLKAVDAKAALAAFKEFADTVDRQVLAASAAEGAVAAHIKRSSDALAALAKLADVSSAELDRLIAVRVAGLEQSRAISLAFLSLGVLSAGYLFLCFRKVLEGGLREVASHINAMRDGNLTTTPTPWGKDEAALLMITLAQMQASLRQIVSSVRVASDSIVTASTQIASGAMDLSSRTEQSAANLQQTASTMEQMAATVRHNESSVEEVTPLALSNAEVADRGSRIVSEVVSTMHEINTSSGRIGDIVGTIDSIAFQTNILALNAAVEAARAGEQGRGFAVVASEVRALAKRSSAAAREIKALITGSVEQVETGTRVVKDAGATIGEIVGIARRVQALLDEVSAGARQQNQGVAMSAKSVQELDVTQQQNAALVEQTAAAASSLREQAQALAARVSHFKLPAHA